MTGAIKRVAVTGGSGHLGSYVVDRLKGDYELTVVDMKPPRDADVAFKAVSVLDLAALVDVFERHDALVHLAAINQPVPEPMQRFVQTNVLGTWNALTAAEAAGMTRCLLCSSDAPLGGEVLWGEPPLDYIPADERHPLYTTTTYALTKQLAESVGAHFANRGAMTVTVLRPTLIVFPGMHESIVAAVEAESAAHQLPSYQRDTPGHEPVGSLRAYVRPQDVARAFHCALNTQPRERFRCYFIAAADTFEPEPTLTYLQERFGVLPEVRKPLLFERQPRSGLLDISRAAEELGWHPEGDWPTILRGFDPGLARRFDKRRTR